jgi:hypothetical protein
MADRLGLGEPRSGNPLAGMRRINFPLAAMGGLAALVLSFGAAVSALQTDAGRIIWVSVVAGAAGGGFALYGPDRIGTLAVADGFLAIALLSQLFGFGLLFLQPLVAILLVTLDTPVRTTSYRRAEGVGFVAGPAPRAPRLFRRLELLRQALADDEDAA